MDRLVGVVAGALETALRSSEPDRLAYLAATSKAEHAVRDLLAWQLHGELGESWLVAREWKRRDLSVHERDGAPRLVLEAKALYTFDVVGHEPRCWSPHLDSLEGDLAKAKLTAPAAERLALVVVQHVATTVPPGLAGIVKYRDQINKALAGHGGGRGLWLEAERCARGWVDRLGEPCGRGGPSTVWGRVFGLDVAVRCHLHRVGV